MRVASVGANNWTRDTSTVNDAGLTQIGGLSRTCPYCVPQFVSAHLHREHRDRTAIYALNRKRKRLG